MNFNEITTLLINASIGNPKAKEIVNNKYLYLLSTLDFYNSFLYIIINNNLIDYVLTPQGANIHKLSEEQIKILRGIIHNEKTK